MHFISLLLLFSSVLCKDVSIASDTEKFVVPPPTTTYMNVMYYINDEINISWETTLGGDLGIGIHQHTYSGTLRDDVIIGIAIFSEIIYGVTSKIVPGLTDIFNRWLA
jgi:hypothetical protein